MMNELNTIWKKHTGADLTTEEAWKMVEFVGMLLENADKNIDKEDKKRQYNTISNKNWDSFCPMPSQTKISRVRS